MILLMSKAICKNSNRWTFKGRHQCCRPLIKKVRSISPKPNSISKGLLGRTSIRICSTPIRTMLMIFALSIFALTKRKQLWIFSGNLRVSIITQKVWKRQKPTCRSICPKAQLIFLGKWHSFCNFDMAPISDFSTTKLSNQPNKSEPKCWSTKTKWLIWRWRIWRVKGE